MPDQSTKTVYICVACSAEFTDYRCRPRVYCSKKCRAVHHAATQDMASRFGELSIRPVADRFWEKVDQSSPDGCWLWTGARSPQGYGRFQSGGRVNGRSSVASRFSWQLAFGPIPAGMFVLHRCDNPPCVRPDHLFLGTNSDNMADMVNKGRYVSRERLPRGEAHPCARLTEADVIEIRQRFASGETRTSLAKTFGVSLSTVHDIIRRNIWRHV